MSVQQNFTYTFPAIRGVQAGREYYSFMCPLRFLPPLFENSDIELPPELNSQRMLNKGRIPALTRYIVNNPQDYAFSSLTASVSGSVSFKPVSDQPPIDNQIGTLTVPMSAVFAINDGQHRLAALKRALKESDSLKYESISIVLFIDQGLKRSQQMFADLNRYAVRPTKSLSLLYDHRDPLAKLAYNLTQEVSYFVGMVEMERPTISNRSKKLFTLSSIYQATNRFLGKREGDRLSDQEESQAVDFWEALGKNIPHWQMAAKDEISSAELRKDYVHAHGISMQALANAGSALAKTGKGWKKRFNQLKDLDWRRSNTALWEGRATIGGVINRSQSNITLTGNLIKQKLELPLEPHEEAVEAEYLKGKPIRG